jgi:hypothetical protein
MEKKTMSPAAAQDAPTDRRRDVSVRKSAFQLEMRRAGVALLRCASPQADGRRFSMLAGASAFGIPH